MEQVAAGVVECIVMVWIYGVLQISGFEQVDRIKLEVVVIRWLV